MANPYQRNKYNFIYRNGCAEGVSKKIKETMGVKGKPDIIDIIQ